MKASESRISDKNIFRRRSEEFSDRPSETLFEFIGHVSLLYENLLVSQRIH